jgi:CII-binding regulator of phage lambda lysogenization HflD
MSHAPLAVRVEMVENTVKALATLPDRFEALGGRFEALEERVGLLASQVVQLGQETRVESSAVHTGLAALHAADAAIRADVDGLRTEMREGFAATKERMQELNGETRRHMLILHEEVLNRIALIGEGSRRRRR